ncbi:MAG: sensor histidine kinase [Algibacter sp.]
MTLINLKLIIQIPAIFFIAGICIAQETSIDKIKYAVKLKKWHIVDSLSKNINSKTLNEDDNAKLLFFLGEANFKTGNFDNAFNKLEKARVYYIKINNKRLQARTENIMIECIGNLNDALVNADNLIVSFCKLSYELNDYLLICDCHYHKANQALDRFNNSEGIFHFKKISKLALKNKDSIKYYNNQLNIGTLLGYYEKNPKASIQIYNEVIPYFKERKDYDREFLAKYNLSIQHKETENYKAAINTLISADSIPITEQILENKKILYKALSEYYEKIVDYKKSHLYLQKSNQIKDSIDSNTKIKEISEIQTKYQTAEKEKQLLIEKQKRKQNFNLLIGALVIILFGGITAFLLQKNTRKKQKLAEQEKALETQKLATILKEQELVSIDAMIEGQEKERQRIANDLHDDLGGLMATVKLHFNVLKDKQTPELFDKTNSLLDEAYNKIRGIAHAKNSGVIAKQGLLIAVQNMADKISVANKIKVHVIDHGLENRLENSLELTLFRIIQELIANVIKHAEATETTIHLTNHKETLNLMIEDNGKGFNPKQITTKTSGMGIHSIDKRVEHLNGSMTIESEINKGTSVIIDIPI